jgi:hypothetical protein
MFSLKSWMRRLRASRRPNRMPITRSAHRLAVESLEDRLTPSHFRGGTIFADVSPGGVATLTAETLWRKGAETFPFDGVSSIQILSDSRAPLRTVSSNIIGTTVLRDTTDPNFNLRRQNITFDLQSLGLQSNTWYIFRYESGARIGGILNAPEGNFSLESRVRWGSTPAGTPHLDSTITTVIPKGHAFSTNVNATDPNGPLSYQFLVGTAAPTYGPSFQIPGIAVDATGEITIPASNTATLGDNTLNPGGITSSSCASPIPRAATLSATSYWTPSRPATWPPLSPRSGTGP